MERMKWMSMMEGQGELVWLKYVVVFLIGPWDVKLAVLAVFFLIDLSSGVYASRKKGHFSSAFMVEKTKSKFYAYMVVVIVLNLIDLILGTPNTMRNGAILALILNELYSIATNLGRLGHTRIETMLKGFYEELMNDNKMPPQDEEKGQGDDKKQRGEKDEES